MERRVCRIPALVGAAFLLFCILVGCLWPRGREVLQRLVFSGDPAVTAAALEGMTEQLREGAALADAFREFCADIMEGAGFGGH